jgi:hypothetical protein
MEGNIEQIKAQILSALDHDEAEDGLYFENLFVLHEEDTRTAVRGTKPQILEAIQALLTEGQIEVEENGKEKIFRRPRA